MPQGPTPGVVFLKHQRDRRLGSIVRRAKKAAARGETEIQVVTRGDKHKHCCEIAEGGLVLTINEVLEVARERWGGETIPRPTKKNHPNREGSILPPDDAICGGSEEDLRKELGL